MRRALGEGNLVTAAIAFEPLVAGVTGGVMDLNMASCLGKGICRIWEMKEHKWQLDGHKMVPEATQGMDMISIYI